MLFGINPYRRGGTYGGAHFASEKEIRRDLKLRGDRGLILGIHKGEYLRTDEPLSVLIYAPPGSGKTAGVIIPSLLSCGNSALVHERNITRNTSEAEEGLVLSQEVMSLPAFETLVLMQNHFETPVRAKAAAWFKDSVMKKRVEESFNSVKKTL